MSNTCFLIFKTIDVEQKSARNSCQKYTSKRPKQILCRGYFQHKFRTHGNLIIIKYKAKPRRLGL